MHPRPFTVIFYTCVAILSASTFFLAIWNHRILVRNETRLIENRQMICKHLAGEAFAKEFFRCELYVIRQP
jgi:hypothetical protein